MSDMPQVGKFCWNELATPNLKTAKDFYGKVFGWEFSDIEMGESIYTMIKRDDKEFAGIWSIPKEQQTQIPPHWMSYILVENLEAALEKAQQNGAKVVKDATNAGEIGRLAIITDPTGAHLALWQTLQMK